MSLYRVDVKLTFVPTIPEEYFMDPNENLNPDITSNVAPGVTPTNAEAAQFVNDVANAEDGEHIKVPYWYLHDLASDDRITKCAVNMTNLSQTLTVEELIELFRLHSERIAFSLESVIRTIPKPGEKDIARLVSKAYRLEDILMATIYKLQRGEI